MDPATCIGIVLAFVGIFASMLMEGGNPAAIFLPPALILVFVGTFGAAMAGGILPDTIGSVKAAIKALTSKVSPSDALLDDIVKLAERARREGLLALEDAAKSVENVFLQRGLQMAIDGTDPEELREILDAEMEAKRAGDKVFAKFFTAMGGYAPTIGIIGTVIGLVHVLENLSEPDKLGHLIAGAFIATLWGVMTANVLWLPIAARITRLSELECKQMEIVIEGILAIQSGSNPRMVAQKLRSLLPAAAEEKKAA